MKFFFNIQAITAIVDVEPWTVPWTAKTIVQVKHIFSYRLDAIINIIYA